MITEQRVMELLREKKVFYQGHFRLTSGRHSNGYLQMAQLLQYPDASEEVGRALADMFRDLEVQTVVGPALGGILVAYEVARHLGCRAVFAEREDGKMKLRRGFFITPGERVLLVEDVITTGGSVNEVAEIVAQAGGTIVGVGAIADRSNGRVDFGVRYASLIKLDIETFSPAECPLCRQGVSIEKPGSRS